ncbi:MAG: c-type cytochrome [Planctomycetota bacterium]|jgi:cytochrome c oxidase cbb3-type subunit 2
MRAVLPVALLGLAALVAAQGPRHGPGRKAYAALACWQCHVQQKDRGFPLVVGSRRAGPVLDDVVQPRSEQWHIAHFFAPRALAAESVMPGYSARFTRHPLRDRIEEFIRLHDQDGDGIVTYSSFSNMAWPKELDTSGNGIISRADAAWQPDAQLEALATYLAKLAPERPPAAEPPGTRPARDWRRSVERGKALFARHCAGCHGEKADGNGVAAEFFPEHPPRNFVRAQYRFRSTPIPDPPTDDDLFMTIRRGAGPSMPAWPEFRDGEVWDLVEFLKSLHPDYKGGRWDEDAGPRPITIGESPVTYSAESAAIGAKVYAELQCANCHGEQGRGDGKVALEQRGSLGQTIRPTDYSRGPRWLKGGADARSLVRTFVTGLHGTPMPSYATALKGVKSADADKAPWHLAHFVMRQARIPFPR